MVLWENQHSSLALVYHLSPLLGQRLSIGYSNEILLSGKGKVLQYLLQQCGVLVVDWVMVPQCWPQSKSEMETGLSEHLCQWNYKYLKRKIGFNWNIAHCSSYLTATVTYLNRSAGGPPFFCCCLLYEMGLCAQKSFLLHIISTGMSLLFCEQWMCNDEGNKNILRFCRNQTWLSWLHTEKWRFVREALHEDRKSNPGLFG